jgi:hypothetical protein
MLMLSSTIKRSLSVVFCLTLLASSTGRLSAQEQAAPKDNPRKESPEEAIRKALEEFKKKEEPASPKPAAPAVPQNPRNLDNDVRRQVELQLQQVERQLEQARARAQARRQFGVAPRFLDIDGRLGATLEKVHPVLVDQLDLPRGQGLVIRAVKVEAAAANAGLKSNDILWELNGKPVPDDMREFARLLGDIQAKTPVGAVVLRKGQKETIKELMLP